jgi:hypothetical protein
VGLIVPIREFTRSEIAGGAVLGETVFARIVDAIAKSRTSGAVFLDFAGIEVATYSFLRASVLSLRRHCSENRRDAPVIIANANTEVLEELEVLLAERGDALVVCDLYATVAANPRVIGTLDSMQALTLGAIVEYGESDAPTLARRFEASDDRRFTKWNNRLTALVKKGILRERTVGRSKFYSPVIEGLTYGN